MKSGKARWHDFILSSLVLRESKDFWATFRKTYRRHLALSMNPYWGGEGESKDVGHFENKKTEITNKTKKEVTTMTLAND